MMPSRARITAILDGEDPIVGRSVAFAIQALIVISALSVAVETLPDLPDWAYRLLAAEEIGIVAIFTVEYVLRIWSAPKRLGYVFSFWGVIDLAAILPSLLLLGADMRALRSFRLLRLLRLFKLVRYSAAADRLAAAFRSVRTEMVLFLFLSLIILYLSAAGIYFFEHEAQPEAFASIPHSLWWAIATLTTVGYGDVFPVTAGGKAFTFFVLLIGLGVIAIPTGLIATALATGSGDGNVGNQTGQPESEQEPKSEGPGAD